MDQFDVRIMSNGPIMTVHVIDSEGNLEVGVNENLEVAASLAVTKMLQKKLAKHPAVELLEDFVETADADVLFDKAEKLLRDY